MLTYFKLPTHFNWIIFMCMITLIASVHSVHGFCNSNELYRIIQQIAPDVIFEEIPSNKFTAIYNGLLSDSLETFTIKKYLQKYPIAHFPVDLESKEMNDLQFRTDLKNMFNVFNQHNSEYNNLSTQHIFQTEQFGFPYLSSNFCLETIKYKKKLEAEILKDINLEILSQTYLRWIKFVHERENAMIKNINRYCEYNKFENAIFLVGTEHRKPIMDIVLALENSSKNDLSWNFDYFK